MNLIGRYLFYFAIGGLMTALVIALEEFGSPILSGIAATAPIFTWIAYLFIGQFGTAQQISEHAKFVLFGTIFSWVPYMLTIIYLSPKIGVSKSVLCAIGVFLISVLIFTYVYSRIH